MRPASIGATHIIFSVVPSIWYKIKLRNIGHVYKAQGGCNKEYIFKGKVLSAKIDFTLGDEAKIAALHYELWKMTHKGEHRQTSLTLYQTLYKTTPNIEYKEWMEEMQNYRNEELQELGISKD